MPDLQQRKNYMLELMQKLNFPADAQQTFTTAIDRIMNNKLAAVWFDCLLQQYDESEDCAYKQMLTEARALGQALDIHEYTISMLLFLCMTEKLHDRYLERGIAEEIYDASMADLAYKLEECRLVHGVHGSFVAYWFRGFFKLTRFALCRLQFEIVTTKEDYTFDGITLAKGSKAINVHIPRTGTRLDHDEVLTSYRLAAEMFADEFASQPIVFTCHSWLLDPWNKTVLSPTSNMAAFYNDFHIVESGNYDGYGEMWRLFDCMYTGDVAALPQNSSLRRAYAQRIERGEPVAWGRGMFVYHDKTQK